MSPVKVKEISVFLALTAERVGGKPIVYAARTFQGV